jgi:holliday junction resolvase Hjr
MGNRQRGDYLERQVKACLVSHGWWVIRAAGSHGLADLVAMRRGQTPLAISCKLDGRVGPADRDALRYLADMAAVVPVIASRKRRGYVFLEVLGRDGTRHALDELHVPPALSRAMSPD